MANRNPSSKFILALDQGTTSSRAIVFDRAGRTLAGAQREFRQFFPRPGWVEHDAEEICRTQIQVAKEAVRRAGLQASQIAAIGITNQRETVVIWDRDTGRPIAPALVWQDRRTADFCAALKRRRLAPMVRRKTGLVLDPYFSATKIHWLLQNIRGARQQAKAGRLACGTIDSWLVWKLTGGRCHVTDASNASRTLLYNLETGDWDPALLKLFDIPAALLPEVRSSSEVYGQATLFDRPVPIAGLAGDQQAALFGQACLRPGMVKNTYGTGCFMLMHTGCDAIPSRHRLLTSVAWRLGSRDEFALEGSVFVAGAVVQWLRDGLGLIRSAPQTEGLAREVDDTGGVYLVPAFAGLGAPHWDPFARGLVCGLTRGTTRAHLVRAALESIAFQTADVVQAMEQDAGMRVRELRVDGGASANAWLMQFQSDVLNVPVVRPHTTETTALGAAYLAGLAVGVWKNPAEIASQWRAERTFEPHMSAAQRRPLLEGWNQALQRAKL